MLAQAWREVRHHPGRVVATLIAIAISVAFIAGASVFLGTEQNALGKQGAIQFSSTDVVAQLNYSPDEMPLPAAEVVEKVKKVDGVEAVEPVFLAVGMLAKEGKSTDQVQFLSVPGESFRWSKLKEGTWAQKADEITLTRQLADDFGAKVGDTLEFDRLPVKVVGISDDPTTKLFKYAYIGMEHFTSDPKTFAQSYTINLKDGANTDAVVAELQNAIPGFEVQSAKTAQDAFVSDLANGIDVFRYVFGVFQFIAILVGMIIIANTFTILITQRRRQIGLLRAVGASSGQVQRQFFAEALVLGALGSLGGILLGYVLAAAGSWWTGSLQFGISFPWPWLLLAFGIGVLITVLAAFVPIFRTTRVTPLEALQPVLNADAEKRVSRIRAVVIGILFLIGAALAVAAMVGDKDPSLYLALGATFFLTIAVLFGASLYVPTLLRLLGRAISWTGPTSRLAVLNSARNPQRAAATAVALMLAMGLIVTLQVGTATIRTTLVAEIEQQFPVDVSVVSMGTPLSEADQKTVTGADNIDQITTLRGGTLQGSGQEHMFQTVLAADDKLSKVAETMPASIPDDVAYVATSTVEKGQKVTVKGLDGSTITLTPREYNDIPYGSMMVSQSTMQKLVAEPGVMGYWIKVKNRDAVPAMVEQILPVAMSGQVALGGGAMMAGLINQVLDIILLVVTALLGVAVVIALVGVANTLGLSVIERTRESALLRALGMKRGSLRYMLLIEAILLALVGTVVGLLGGTFFAWLGIRGAFRTLGVPTDQLKFAIDPWQTLILLGVAVVCAALASILPGRKAASASPTEALAVD